MKKSGKEGGEAPDIKGAAGEEAMATDPQPLARQEVTTREVREALEKAERVQKKEERDRDKLHAKLKQKRGQEKQALSPAIQEIIGDDVQKAVEKKLGAAEEVFEAAEEAEERDKSDSDRLGAKLKQRRKFRFKEEKAKLVSELESMRESEQAAKAAKEASDQKAQVALEEAKVVQAKLWDALEKMQRQSQQMGKLKAAQKTVPSAKGAEMGRALEGVEQRRLFNKVQKDVAKTNDDLQRQHREYEAEVASELRAALVARSEFEARAEAAVQAANEAQAKYNDLIAKNASKEELQAANEAVNIARNEAISASRVAAEAHGKYIAQLKPGAVVESLIYKAEEATRAQAESAAQAVAAGLKLAEARAASEARAAAMDAELQKKDAELAQLRQQLAAERKKAQEDYDIDNEIYGKQEREIKILQAALAVALSGKEAERLRAQAAQEAATALSVKDAELKALLEANQGLLLGQKGTIDQQALYIAELEQANGNLATIREKIEEQQSELERVTREINAGGEESVALKQTQAAIAQEIKILEAAKAAEQAVKENLLQEIAQHRAEAEEAARLAAANREAQAELSVALAAEQAKLIQAQALRSEIEQRQADLQQQVTAAEVALREQEQHILTKQADLEKVTREIAEARNLGSAELQTLQREQAKIQKELDNLKQTKAAEQAAIEQHRVEERQLVVANAEIKSEIAEAEKAKVNFDKELAQGRAELERIAAERTELQQSQEALKQQVQAVQASEAGVKAKEEELASREQRLTEEKARLEQESRDNATKITGLEAQIAAGKNKGQVKKGKIGELEAKLQEAQQKDAANARQLAELTRLQDEFTQEKARLAAQLEAQQRASEEKIAALNAEIEQGGLTKAAMETLQAELVKERATLVQVTEEITAVRSTAKQEKAAMVAAKARELAEIEQHKAEAQRLADATLHAQTSLGTIQAEIHQLLSAKAATAQEQEELNAQLTEKRAEMARIEAEKVNLNQKQEALQKKTVAVLLFELGVKAREKALLAEQEKLGQERVASAAKIAALEVQIAAGKELSESEKAALRDELAREQGKLQAATDRTNELATQLQEKEANISQQNLLIAELQEANASLEGIKEKIADQERELARVQAAIEDENSKGSQVNEGLKREQAKIKELITALTARKEAEQRQVEGLQAEIEQHKAEAEHLASEKAKAQAGLDEVVRGIAAAQAEIDAATQVKARLDREVAAGEAELERVKAANKELEQRQVTLIKQAQAAEALLKQQAEQTRAQILEGQAELERITQAIANAQKAGGAELEALKAEQAALAQGLQKLKETEQAELEKIEQHRAEAEQLATANREAQVKAQAQLEAIASAVREKVQEIAQLDGIKARADQEIKAAHEKMEAWEERLATEAAIAQDREGFLQGREMALKSRELYLIEGQRALEAQKLALEAQQRASEEREGRLRDRLSALEDNNRELNTRLQKMIETGEVEQAVTSGLRELILKAKAETREVQDMLESSEREAKAQLAQAEMKAKHEIEAVKQQLQSAQKRIIDLDNIVGAQKKEFAQQLQDEKVRFEEIRAELTAQHDRLIEEFQGRIAEREKTLAAQEQMFNQGDAALAQMQGQIHREIEELRQQLQTREQVHLRQLQGLKADYSNHVERIRATYDRHIEDITQEKNAHLAGAAQLRDQLEQFAVQNEQLQQQLQVALEIEDADKSDLRQLLHHAQRQVREAEFELDLVLSSNEEFKAKLKQAKREADQEAAAAAVRVRAAEDKLSVAERILRENQEEFARVLERVRRGFEGEVQALHQRHEENIAALRQNVAALETDMAAREAAFNRAVAAKSQAEKKEHERLNGEQQREIDGLNRQLGKADKKYRSRLRELQNNQRSEIALLTARYEEDMAEKQEGYNAAIQECFGQLNDERLRNAHSEHLLKQELNRIRGLLEESEASHDKILAIHRELIAISKQQLDKIKRGEDEFEILLRHHKAMSQELHQLRGDFAAALEALRSKEEDLRQSIARYAMQGEELQEANKALLEKLEMVNEARRKLLEVQGTLAAALRALDAQERARPVRGEAAPAPVVAVPAQVVQKGDVHHHYHYHNCQCHGHPYLNRNEEEDNRIRELDRRIANVLARAEFEPIALPKPIGEYVPLPIGNAPSDRLGNTASIIAVLGLMALTPVLFWSPLALAATQVIPFMLMAGCFVSGLALKGYLNNKFGAWMQEHPGFMKGLGWVSMILGGMVLAAGMALPAIPAASVLGLAGIGFGAEEAIRRPELTREEHDRQTKTKEAHRVDYEQKEANYQVELKAYQDKLALPREKKLAPEDQKQLDALRVQRQGLVDVAARALPLEEPSARHYHHNYQYPPAQAGEAPLSDGRWEQHPSAHTSLRYGVPGASYPEFDHGYNSERWQDGRWARNNGEYRIEVGG